MYNNIYEQNLVVSVGIETDEQTNIVFYIIDEKRTSFRMTGVLFVFLRRCDTRTWSRGHLDLISRLVSYLFTWEDVTLEHEGGGILTWYPSWGSPPQLVCALLQEILQTFLAYSAESPLQSSKIGEMFINLIIVF